LGLEICEADAFPITFRGEYSYSLDIFVQELASSPQSYPRGMLQCLLEIKNSRVRPTFVAQLLSLARKHTMSA